MGRPEKKGLSFFPLDVAIDDNLELVEAEYGIFGFGIVIKLWQKIYANGYFVEWEEDNELLFSRRINAEQSKVSEVVVSCFKRGIFDETLYKKYKILTSKGIQKRYIKICSDAKRKNNFIIKKYDLVNTELSLIDSIKTEFTTEETELTQEESTQSKEEEIREDNSKENKKKNTRFALPSVDEIKQYCQERNNNVDAETFIDFYTAKDWFVGKNKMKDWKAAVRTWEKRSYNNISATQTKPKVVAPWYKGDEQVE